MAAKLHTYTNEEMLRLNLVLEKLVAMNNPIAKVIQSRIGGLLSTQIAGELGAFYAWAYQFLTMFNLALNSKMTPPEFAVELDKAIMIQEVPHDTSKKQPNEDGAREVIGPEAQAN